MSKKLRKIIDKFEILKIFSVVLAIILFLAVNPLFSNPIWNELFENSVIIQNVQVEVEYDENAYTIEGIPDRIDVRVSGNENEVKNAQVKSTNLVAKINLSDYKPGTSEVSKDQFSFNLQGGASYSPTQNTFTINVQDKISKPVPVSLTYINGDQLSQGLMLEASSLDTTNVTVSGGSEDVESVSTIFALADLTELQIAESRGTETLEVPLVAYNSNGNRVDGITLEPDTVILEQSYSVQSVTLPVIYEYTNNDTGMFVSNICPIGETDCDENYVEEVEVYGNSTKINDLSSITYQVDLSGVDESGGDVSGTPILESDIFIVDENKHEYHVEFEEGQTITIEDVTVKTQNLDNNFTAVAPDPDQATVDVTITGANSQIENLKAKDINVYADLTDYTQPGVYEVPVVVQRDKNLTYELSTDVVTIELKESDS